MLNFKSKLPSGDTTIFTIMSNLAVEYDAINLGQGFPNFDCDPILKDKVNFYQQEGKNQYAPMTGVASLRKRISSKMDLLYNTKVDYKSEITITAGATQALFTAITAFVHIGDEVIIIEPAYDSYIPSIKLAGGVPVPYALHGPEFRIDWDEFKKLITPKTRMIIINTPHNPIGKIMLEEDMEALQDITNDTNILVLSDEVYEHLVFYGYTHHSVVRYPKLFERSIAVFSFGKTFHNTGWKIGYVVAPEYLMMEFRKVHQWNVFSVNSFVQYGLADYMNNPETYLSLPQFYQAKCDLFTEAMEGSSLKSQSCEGTFFQLYDYSQVSKDRDLDFCKELTIKHGVVSIPISVFYTEAPDQHYIRFCFAKNDETLLQAGRILQGL